VQNTSYIYWFFRSAASVFIDTPFIGINDVHRARNYIPHMQKAGAFASKLNESGLNAWNDPVDATQINAACQTVSAVAFDMYFPQDFIPVERNTRLILTDINY